MVSDPKFLWAGLESKFRARLWALRLLGSLSDLGFSEELDPIQKMAAPNPATDTMNRALSDCIDLAEGWQWADDNIRERNALKMTKDTKKFIIRNCNREMEIFAEWREIILNMLRLTAAPIAGADNQFTVQTKAELKTLKLLREDGIWFGNTCKVTPANFTELQGTATEFNIKLAI